MMGTWSTLNNEILTNYNVGLQLMSVLDSTDHHVHSELNIIICFKLFSGMQVNVLLLSSV